MFAKRRPKYPGQIELPEWAPGSKEAEAKRRIDFARSQLDLWKNLLDAGLKGHLLSFYDAP